jgi:putative tricarboxylic transport membrane protein
MEATLFDAILASLAPASLGLTLFGVIFGLIFGIIPGLTATLAVALLLPVTYGLTAAQGVILLLGAYVGGISGGVVSAILIGMPGTPSSITSVFDGHPMARKGLAGKALGIGAISNLTGTLFSWIILIAMAPQLSKIALEFSTLNITAVIIFGLTTVISLSGDSLLRGIVAASFGLLVCAIGIDPMNGETRMTMGIPALESGINAIPAMIGLFVVGELFVNIAEPPTPTKSVISGFRQAFLTLRELKQSLSNMFRSCCIGAAIGILPGIGGSLANFVAYDQAKKASKEPETFGTGNIQGLIASETSNNAAIGGALIPMLTLGIPGDTVTAVLMGGLQLHGIDPGPLMFRDHPFVVDMVYVSFFIAAVLMFLSMVLLGTRLFPKLLLLKRGYILPFVLIASTAGCYNMNTSMMDVWTAVIFGIIGFFLKRYHFPATPVVIGMILGKMLEMNLRQALVDTGGSLLPFVRDPVCVVFLTFAVLSIVYSMRQRRRKNTVRHP